ncbi:hypothetical protein J1N35_038112 [Gossypium stocksii]|uniref:Uncharacterized protein n=1 Tax=Gossypium stocksii TaxID=47602 RepID=A0A9D3ZMC8_9ROSI|nr:hypothetical protein J1N35_038112 [Gossypium stocksii]
MNGDAIIGTSGIADPATLCYDLLGRSPGDGVVRKEWVTLLIRWSIDVNPSTYGAMRSSTISSSSPPSLKLKPQPDPTPSMSFTHSIDGSYHLEMRGWP